MTSRDWPVQNNYNQEHNERMNEERAKFLAIYPVDLWSKRTVSTALRILDSIGAGIETYPEDDSNEPVHLIEKIKQVEVILLSKNGNRLNLKDVETYAICIGLGASFAEYCPVNYEICEKLAEILVPYETIYKAWLKYFSREKYNLLHTDIVQLPNFNHSLSEEQLKFKKQLSDDEWRYINSTRQEGKELILTNAIQFKNDLMFAKDKRRWIEWLLTLPNIYIQTVAIRPIRELEEWKESLIILFKFSRLYESEKKKEIQLLATLFLYECFMTVEGSIQQLLEKLSILNNELITEILQNALANIQINILPEQKILKNIRKACIKHLSNHLGDSIPFFIRKQTPTSLLVAMLLHFEVHNSKNCKEIWKGYLTVIEHNEFFWSHSLQKELDDYQFLWLSAGILAQQNSPLESFKLAVNRYTQPTEGWGGQNEEFYKTNKQLVHLYIVGAMASEWLVAKKRKKEAGQLYNFVFHKTTDYLRKSLPYETDFIDPLIIELWSRLPLITPSNYIEIALYTIPLYDEYKHILLALTELYKSSNNKIDIKLFMREIHEAHFPLEKLMHAHNENILKWYEQFDWWEE